MRYDAVIPLLGSGPLVYVDCGARGSALPSWLRPAKTARYIGIEADAAECERLTARQKPRHEYIAAALGRSAEARTLYVTKNPACSSLLRPNSELLAPFGEMSDFFIVEREVAVSTIPLDMCLARHSITSVDFLELDTQGAELEVLEGAERVLDASVLGLLIEVEFAPMYHDQPLFGDVDRFMRSRGFELFDLMRYRVRRGPLASTIPTRGQLLWGRAFYLRAPSRCQSPAMLRRLAGLAALAGIPDLTLDILSRVGSDVSSDVRKAVCRAQQELDQSGSIRVWRD